MRISASELAMLTIAFNGETKPGIPRIKFKTVDVPEWFLEMINRSDLTSEYSTDGTEIIVASIDRDSDIRKVANIVGLYEPRVVLYNNRWITAPSTKYYVTDTHYSDFLKKFEENVNVHDDAMIKPFGKMDDIRLFLVLNFLFKWSKGKYYEEKGVTTFECFYNALPDNISISDLAISNKITILPYVIKNSWSNILYIQVEAINLTEMLDIWYMKEIVDSDVETAAKEYFSQPLCRYLLNAFHQFEIERSDCAYTSPNKVDLMVANFMDNLSNTELKLFTAKRTSDDNIAYVPRYLFNLGYITELTVLDNELDILIKESDHVYRDISGDIVVTKANTPMREDITHVDQLDMLEKYVAGNPYQGIDYCISHLRILKNIKHYELSGYPARMPSPKLHGGFHSSYILNEFANYHILQSNVSKDSDMNLFIDANIKKLSRAYDVFNGDVIIEFIHSYISAPKSEHDPKKDFVVIADKIDNPLIWDLGISGMIDFLTVLRCTTDYVHEVVSLERLLIKLQREVPNNIFETSKSSLMTIAQSDMNYVEKDGEDLILVCAALNQNTYRTTACTEYIIDSTLSKIDVMQNGLVNLRKIIFNCNIKQIKELLGKWLMTNRIPIPIRLFGCDLLKDVIIRKYDLLYENRKEFNAILKMLENCSYSNVHILKEYYTSNSIRYGNLLRVIFAAHKFDLIPNYTITNIVDEHMHPDTILDCIDAQQLMLKKLDPDPFHL